MKVQVLCHSSIRIETNHKIIYCDPFKIRRDSHDADIILITHSHYDHFSEEDILKIAGTYHQFVNDDNYEDISGYCKAATIEEIKDNNYVLTPGRYVGVEETEDDGIPFEEKMKTITSELKEQFEESHKLEEEIKKNLEAIGYGI